MIYDLVWWMPLILIVPFWLLTNTTHELAHGLVYRWWGWDIEIRVIPYFMDTRCYPAQTHYFWTKRKWWFTRPPGVYGFFASYTPFYLEGATPLPRWSMALASFAPQIMDALILGSCVLIAHIGNNAYVTTVAATWAFTNLVDSCWNWGRIFQSRENHEHLDSWRFHDYTGWPLIWVRVLGVAWISAMLFAFIWR